jgi:hypothetical protein
MQFITGKGCPFRGLNRTFSFCDSLPSDLQKHSWAGHGLKLKGTNTLRFLWMWAPKQTLLLASCVKYRHKGQEVTCRKDWAHKVRRLRF